MSLRSKSTWLSVARFAPAVAVVAWLLPGAKDARADEDEPSAEAPPSPPHPKDGVFFGAATYAGWLRDAPTMQLRSGSAGRDVVGLSVPSSAGKGLGLVGASADVGLAKGSVVFSLARVRYARGVTSVRESGATEGQPLTMDSGATNLVELSVLNTLGFRGPLGPFQVELLPDFGFGYAWGDVSVTRATGSVAKYTFDNSYVFVRAEIDVCHDWQSARACLSLMPNVALFGDAYDKGSFFNGGYVGLRVEL